MTGVATMLYGVMHATNQRFWHWGAVVSMRLCECALVAKLVANLFCRGVGFVTMVSLCGASAVMIGVSGLSDHVRSVCCFGNAPAGPLPLLGEIGVSLAGTRGRGFAIIVVRLGCDDACAHHALQKRTRKMVSHLRLGRKKQGKSLNWSE